MQHVLENSQRGITTDTPLTLSRAGRIVAWTLTGVLLIMAGYSLVVLLTDPIYALSPGFDHAMYRDASARWLAGGFFYYPEQVAGSYQTLNGHVMYPPVALALFVPFVYLPAVLWWAVPIGIVCWFVWSMRPGPRGCAAMAACLAWPITVELLVSGNPVMWVVAAFALSFRWPWVGVLVLLKPSLFPFALGGIRTRASWVALAVFGLVSLAFLPMWFDWVNVVLNARGPFSGLLYSLKDVPMILIPLIAWSTRQLRLGDAIHADCAAGDVA